MFYRPDAPGKQAYLKIYATNHAQMKKLSQSVQALAGNGGVYRVVAMTLHRGGSRTCATTQAWKISSGQ